jgi:hypothetical protein
MVHGPVWSLPTVLVALISLVGATNFGSKEGEVDRLTNPRKPESDTSASNHPLLFPEHGWKYDSRYTRFRYLPANESLQNREWQHDLKRFQAEISRKQSECSRKAGCYTQGRSGTFALSHFYIRNGSHPLRRHRLRWHWIFIYAHVLGVCGLSYSNWSGFTICSLLPAPIRKAPGCIDTPTDSFPG